MRRIVDIILLTFWGAFFAFIIGGGLYFGLWSVILQAWAGVLVFLAIPLGGILLIWAIGYALAGVGGSVACMIETPEQEARRVGPRPLLRK